MSFFISSFYITIKQYFRSKTYYIASALVLLLILFLYNSIGNEILSLKIGIIFNKNSPISNELVQNLTQENIETVFYNDKESLVRDVTSGKLECGYIINNNFDEMINSGNYIKLVLCITSPKTISASVTNEIMSSAIFRIISPRLATNYLTTEGILDLQTANLNIQEQFSSFYKEGNYLKAEYENIYAAAKNIIRKKDKDIFHGIIAIFVFLLMYSFALSILQQKKGEVYNKLNSSDRKIFLLSNTASGALVVIFFSSLLLFIIQNFGISGGNILNFFILFLYVLVLSVILFVALLLFKDNAFLYALLPIIATAECIFGGAFVNLASINPILGTIEAFFPSTYYLQLITF